MTDNSIINSEEPIVTLSEESDGKLIMLGGQWTLRTLAASPDSRQSIKKFGAVKDKQWDISHINQLDSAAAFLLWQAWGEILPIGLIMRPEHRRLFDYWKGRNISVSQPTLLDFTKMLHLWLTQFEQQFEATDNSHVLMSLAVSAFTSNDYQLLGRKSFRLSQKTVSPDVAGAIAGFVTLTEKAKNDIQVWLGTLSKNKFSLVDH